MLAWPIILIPLGIGVLLLVTGRRWPGRSAGWLASGGVAVSFVLAIVQTANLASKPSDARLIVSRLYDWIVTGSFRVDLATRFDPLSAVMTLVVTGVGALILFYSIGYMRGDPRFTRYFAYKSLFVAAMLTLVLASNYLVLYIGWEGVGLASYLLIGFWFERPAAAAAAKKAFVVTRVGDAAFLIGIILIWARVGSLDFSVVFQAVPGLAAGTVTAIGLLLLAGAVGKSAQVPLHTWLPDAMEGPTPTSALIHAATMVTAGVYLVVRSHPVFDASAPALNAVAVVGIASAIYAGFAAMGQDDIKRVLAYSTISQIGFMFFTAGIGAYGLAIFFLVAHAFFKGLLFLSAGSVIHALDGEQNLMKMGGLHRVLRFTTWMWNIGWLAIAGFPLLVGFFAKDESVGAAALEGKWLLWALALFAVAQTAVYMTRATCMAFVGEPRFEGHPHEPEAVMRMPMAILAMASVFGGILNLTEANGFLDRFLRPVAENAPATSGFSSVAADVVGTSVALAFLAATYYVYGTGRVDWMAMRVRLSGARRVLASGFYVDDVYDLAFGRTGRLGATFLAYVVDRRLIDGFWNGLASLFGLASSGARQAQAGLVRVYAAFFFLGVVGVLAYLAVRIAG
jgi:NADH-quinone oxidoreductase subunit L